MGSGFNRGLLSDTVFEAHKIYKMNKSEVENDQELTEEEIETIRTGDYYSKLATVRSKKNQISFSPVIIKIFK